LALDVDPLTISGSWQRHIPVGGDPLWRPPRDEAPDNRWQRGEVVDALYLSDGDATMWSEWFRSLAEAGIPPSQSLPRDIWRFEVEITVADLSDEDRLARVGLDLPQPGRGTWPPYQAVGEELAAEGWPGLVVPSAARVSGGLNLVVFLPERVVPDNVSPSPPPITVTEVPPPPRGMKT
jgi:RES domain-containing protein